MLNVAPGINSSSAYGADASSGNSLLIDGVDTRDPSSGTPWTFYNYNIIEEIQIQGLGASAEYGGFTGAVINTITKSGGNRFAGLFETLFTNDSLGSNNVSQEIIDQNLALRDPSVTTQYVDLTAQLGGPIKQNKAFFFVSAQRFLLEQDPSGAVTRRHEVSPRLNFKLTFQPTTNDTLTGHLQFDAYNITGRADLGLQTTDELTNRRGCARVRLAAQLATPVRIEHLRRGEVHRLVGLLRPQPGSERSRATSIWAPASTRCRRAGSTGAIASGTRLMGRSRTTPTSSAATSSSSAPSSSAA